MRGVSKVGDINKAIQAMYWAADSDQVGYSQSDRESLQEHDFFGGDLYNTDCSKLVIEALQYAGFDTCGATYTGNMSANLCARGWQRIPVDWNPQPGYVLLNDVDHVAMMLYNGDLGQASIGEGGLVSGGARGDQTGWETNTRPYYDYPWDCYLVPPAEIPPEPEPPKPWKDPDMERIMNVGGKVYRFYDKSTGNHMFTCDNNERNALKTAGWIEEGIAFEAPRGGEWAVYRLYNPNNGDHLFTSDFEEASSIQLLGWIYEGSPFSSLAGTAHGKPIYRMRDKGDGLHMLTESLEERNDLLRAGWIDEGIAFTI